MKFKNSYKSVLILLITLCFVFSVNAQKKPKYLFKIASEAPDGSSWINTIKKINLELKKKTNGELGVRVYSSGVMGDQNSVIEKIKIGQLSGATFSAGGVSQIYKDFAVMGFPMVFRNYGEYDYIKEKMTGHFEKEFEKNGYVLLAWTEVGLIYLYSKKKVYSVDTLKKSKPLLITGDSISQTLFKELGMEPKTFTMADVMTGLQTGLIDTIFSSHYGLITMQWFTKVKYMADFPITFMIGAVLVDKKLFDSMPENYRREMKTLFRTRFDALNQKVRDDNERSLLSLKKNGMITLEVNEDAIQKFYQVSDTVNNRLTEKEYSRSLYQKIKSHINDYRNKK